MELEQAIFGRRSIRQFKDKPVDQSDLEALAEAAIWAPTVAPCIS